MGKLNPNHCVGEMRLKYCEWLRRLKTRESIFQKFKGIQKSLG